MKLILELCLYILEKLMLWLVEHQLLQLKRFAQHYSLLKPKFGVFCAVILLPLLLITHYFLTKLDFHISIVSAVMVTACVFIGYDIFKVYTRKIISKKIIQKAWALHFPYFAYEKYSTMAGEFYKEALKEEIPKANLEQYVLDKIIHSK
ncbi:TPA: hypothetical protein SAU39_000647 [Campylobacter jejuni]|nr:hypothetical protein [Campylobacter jejuni]